VKVVTYGPPYLAIRVMVPIISAPEVRTKQRQPRHSSSRCQTCLAVTAEPFMGSLKPQSNGPLYGNAVIDTLVVDG